ncbi:MAG: LuxR C-terminal-related transcriptional regulator [Planctomycetota bacterium]
MTKLDCTVSVCPTVRSALTGHANGVDLLSAGVPNTRLTALVVLAGPLGDFLQSGVLEEVREAFPSAKLVSLTPETTVAEAVKAMRHGVADVLLGGQAPEELLDGLGAAFRSGLAGAKGAAQTKVLQDRLGTLTAAEDKVLDEMLAGMANKQIAQKLEIGLRTVELRRSKIMRKMHAKSLSELVKFVCVARGIADLSIS